jgi:hypothetical protein
MKKIYLVITAIFLLGLSSFAQKVGGRVKGILQDSASAIPLTDATVSLIRSKDSTLISFTLTEKNGSFEIKNIEAGDYQIVATFQGLQTKRIGFTISADSIVADLGLIRLGPHYKTMDEVVIRDESPVKINGDTLAFRADAFKTKPNATVEDLLKKLPGMQVDKDGTVKAQGEQVQKVYVDGKEFFGSDPKLATKNLNADMIDQVEVFDDMSEQAKFNKIDDGSRSKAINLKLKKDKKKGIFGKANAGYGTGEHYDAGLTANFFKGPSQTSLITKANNTNNIGFTVGDMLGVFNSGGNSGGPGGTNVVRTGGSANFGGLNLGSTGSGLTTTSQLGMNYRDTWSKHFDVNGSYFFNHTQTTNFQRTFRQTFAADTIYINDQQGNSFGRNDNHRFNMNLIYSIDSLNSIIFSPSLNFQNSVNNSDDTTSYDYTAQGTTHQLNESRSFNNNSGNGVNWANNLIWRKRFLRPGRTFSLNFSNTWNNNARETYNIINAKINSRNIYTNTDGESRNYGMSLSYTEPLARNKILEFNYSYSRNGNESDREAFKYDPATGRYDIGYDTLSNHFQNLNEYHRAGTNFRVVQKKYNYQLGVSVQQTLLESNNLTQKSDQTQKFTNIFPTASFNYQFQRNKNLRFNYRGSTRQPSIAQLQDVLDPSRYPYLSKGNPSLKQEFSNNFILGYNFFDMIHFRNLFAFINFNNTYNKIVSSVTQNPDGSQLTIPVNMNGAYMFSANINFGLPIKKMQGGNFNTTTRVSLNRDPSMFNQRKNVTDNLNIGEDLRLNYNYKERLDLGITASINYNGVRYSIQTTQQNQSYFTHTYSADLTYTFNKGFILSSDFDYTFNTGRTNGYNRNYAMWNAGFAKQLFKNKRGEIKLSVFDILNQNVSINRNVGQNYIEDVQNSTIQRFFMLGFVYRINRMGGKSMSRMENGPRGFKLTQ